MFEKMEIKNFKGFLDSAIEFSKFNGQIGSGMTIITGTNNSGKTSILNALTLPQTLDPDVEKDTEIILKFDGKNYKITGCEENNRIKMSDPEFLFIRFTKISSNRVFHNSQAWYEPPEFIKHFQIFSDDLRFGCNQDPKKILIEIDKNPELKDKYIKIIQKIFPDIKDFKFLGVYGGKTNIEYKKGEYWHDIGYIGDGIKTVFLICIYFLYDEMKKYPLIIDEPELHLHPEAQKLLFNLLLEKSKDRQIIISTNSQYFIDWNLIKKGSIIRTHEKDDKCFAKNVNNINGLEHLTQKWNRPFLLDIASKEIFFSNKILFVEGQEDIGLIKKFYKEDIKGFDIFGYGTDGTNNFKLFLELSKKLSLNKVAVLYDTPNVDNKILIEKLKKEYNEFKFFQLPTKDIRTKNKEKGIFKSDGSDFEEGMEEKFNPIIDDIVSYFK